MNRGNILIFEERLQQFDDNIRERERQRDGEIEISIHCREYNILIRRFKLNFLFILNEIFLRVYN